MTPVIDLAVLAVFIPTFFFFSVTPGMCMTLAMTLGMSIGVRRSLYMMWGELLGLALISLGSVIGVASIMLSYPHVFQFLKLLGGIYLLYVGFNMWLSKGKMAITNMDVGASNPPPSRRGLAMQGFFTAITNPKAWALMVSFLPPFINPQQAFVPQLTLLTVIILMTEFTCLMLYATGGRTLRLFLQKSGNVQLMNRIAGSLMIGVGVWLVLG